MSEEEEETVEVVAPKGRGRGRGGGVPILPTGVWQSLQGNTDDNKQNNDQVEQFLKDAQTNQFHDAPKSSEKEYDRDYERGARKGIEKDLKGKDWSCASCTNTNWSWRTNCNMCGTPKPFLPGGDGEFRDGVGGGFNERQERASATAVEIDEEGFDDFGRRVKKEQKAADRKAKEEAALKRLQEKYQYLNPEKAANIPLIPSGTSNNFKQKDDTGKSNENGNTSRQSLFKKNLKGNDARDHRDQRNINRDSRDRRTNQTQNNGKYNDHRSRDSRDRHNQTDRRKDDSRDRKDRRNRSRSRDR